MEEMLFACPSCGDGIGVRWFWFEDGAGDGRLTGHAAVRIEHREFEGDSPVPGFAWVEQGGARARTIDRLVDSVLEETGCVVVERRR